MEISKNSGFSSTFRDLLREQAGKGAGEEETSHKRQHKHKPGKWCTARGGRPCPLSNEPSRQGKAHLLLTNPRWCQVQSQKRSGNCRRSSRLPSVGTTPKATIGLQTLSCLLLTPKKNRGSPVSWSGSIRHWEPAHSSWTLLLHSSSSSLALRSWKVVSINHLLCQVS